MTRVRQALAVASKVPSVPPCRLIRPRERRRGRRWWSTRRSSQSGRSTQVVKRNVCRCVMRPGRGARPGCRRDRGLKCREQICSLPSEKILAMHNDNRHSADFRQRFTPGRRPWRLVCNAEGAPKIVRDTDALSVGVEALGLRLRETLACAFRGTHAAPLRNLRSRSRQPPPRPAAPCPGSRGGAPTRR